mmetsp:Transcript_11499/g.25661  ORF Transcript_11499/g.25661 Transcript_11499/m.25661 type:complete len:296 (+) Transcript_11499:4279-5166(+)
MPRRLNAVTTTSPLIDTLVGGVSPSPLNSFELPPSLCMSFGIGSAGGSHEPFVSANKSDRRIAASRPGRCRSNRQGRKRGCAFGGGQTKGKQWVSTKSLPNFCLRSLATKSIACWCSCRRRWKKVGSYSSQHSDLSSKAGGPEDTLEVPCDFCLPMLSRTSAKVSRKRPPFPVPDEFPSLSSLRVTPRAAAVIASLRDRGSEASACNSSRLIDWRRAVLSFEYLGGGGGSSVTNTQRVVKKDSDRTTAWSGSCSRGGFTQMLAPGMKGEGLLDPACVLRSGSHKCPSMLKRESSS